MAVVKPEWGTKRTSPKTGKRFYDLGRDNPIVCPDTGYEWHPEPILKSKQTLPFEAAKPQAAEGADAELAPTDDLELADADAEEPSVEHDVDIGTDDDLGDVGTPTDEEER